MDNIQWLSFYGKCYTVEKVGIQLKIHGLVYDDLDSVIIEVDWSLQIVDVIKQIQLKIDGEYLCQLKIKNSVYLFTDLLGRYSCFYQLQGDKILLTNVLSNLINDNSKINKNALLDTVIYGFSLLGDSLVEDIETLSVGFYVSIDESSIRRMKFGSLLWWVSEVRVDSASIRDSIVKRLDYVSDRPRESVFADLTGGMDSRMVMLMLKSLDIKFVCQKYVQDEFRIVQKLFHKYGLDGEVTDTEYDFSVTQDNLKFIRRTQGSVNLFTATVCGTEEAAYCELLGSRVIRIMGLGGEFLRKAKTVRLGSLNFALFNYLPEIHLDKLVLDETVKKNYLVHLDRVSGSFDKRYSYIKEYYVRYYFFLVTRIGEARARQSHYIIQPLYTKEIVASYLNNSSYNNVRYFYRLYREIDEDWLDVSIYGMNRYIAKHESLFYVAVKLKELLLIFKRLIIRRLVSIRDRQSYTTNAYVSSRFGITSVRDQSLLNGIYSRIYSLELFFRSFE